MVNVKTSFVLSILFLNLQKKWDWHSPLFVKFKKRKIEWEVKLFFGKHFFKIFKHRPNALLIYLSFLLKPCDGFILLLNHGGLVIKAAVGGFLCIDKRKNHILKDGSF